MTYIYQELTTSQIASQLYADKTAGWSIEGAKALAEYLQEYAQDTGQPIELDTVALRCDYAEYASLDDYNKDAGAEYKTLDDLRDDAGTVLEFEGGIIVGSF